MISHLREPPIFINDLLNTTVDDRALVERMITTRYSSDMITTLPSCRCGITKGEPFKDTICDFCGTSVESSIVDEIVPSVWFRKPEGVEALMIPIAWIMLRQRFRKSGFDIIRWLTDTRYSTTVRQPDVLSKIIAAGIEPGYNNFVRNFDMIMEFLFSLRDFKPKKRGPDYLYEFIRTYRNNLFSDVLPIVNKSILVVENTDLGIYVDNTVVEGVNAINMLVSIDKDFIDQTPGVKENRTARGLAAYADYNYDYYRRILSAKKGQFRKHVGGSRLDFAGRAVISSVTGRHVYDEIQLPWCMGITKFRPYLIRKLLNSGEFTLNEAIGFLKAHVHKYHWLLDQYLKEILAECPNGRYPVIFNRFPSLLQGSMQLVYVSGFKIDPMDMTISTGTLIIRSFNADFDGDAMCVTLSLDEQMAYMWYALQPRFNVLNMASPFSVSSNHNWTKTTLATISNWLVGN